MPNPEKPKKNMENVETNKELWDLKEQILQDENKDDNPEKKEKKFTFKPIAVSAWKSRMKNWEERVNNTTTTVEFAWWWKNLNVYGYARKDWNDYATWFNEWIELFANENLKLGKNFDLNGKQFYWWKWNGKWMVWPQVSVDKQIWNVWVWASVGAYLEDNISWKKNTFDWGSVVSVNFSVKWKDWKTRNGNAFLNISGMEDFDVNKMGTYWEASLETPNFLNPKAAGALCWTLYARYWWNIEDIEISYLWVGLKYKF